MKRAIAVIAVLLALASVGAAQTTRVEGASSLSLPGVSSDGNQGLQAKGGIGSGAGSAVAGFVWCKQGTDPTSRMAAVAPNGFALLCPTAIATPIGWQVPTAGNAAAGVVKLGAKASTNGVDVSQLSVGKVTPSDEDSSSLSGIVRAGNPPTAAELSGDCVTSSSNVVACNKSYQYAQPTSTPAQNSTYFLGINGGSSTTPANKATHYFTQACTLVQVCYYMQIDTTLNTAAENVTFQVGLGGNGSAFSGAMSDTILTLPTNARSGKACATVSDAISANSGVLIQASTPSTWTTPPTGVYWSARLVCR